MKKFVTIILISLSSFFSFSQTIIRYDYMETWNWGGVWFLTGGNPLIALSPNGGVSTWATNVSVTPTESAVLYGANNSSSLTERDWYSLPNVTGLNPNRLYQLKFRLASHSFTSPSAGTRGLDVGDFVEVQVSTDGGISYISELRIRGNTNALWTYNATGSVNHTANGSFTNSLAPTGDIYQSPAGTSTNPPILGNGLTFITLNLQPNITQVAIDILCWVNSAGEEWWIDNIELWDLTPVGLPVELISFEGFNTEKGNLLVWKTASEHNSDYYLIESSTTGEFNENSVIGQKTAAGNSNQLMEYSFLDVNFSKEINYYRITQVDFDGNFKIYGPIDINNLESKKEIVKYVNPLGQEVDDNYKGILFEVYSDGTTKKIYR
jgi:hypothetical protein